MIPSPVSSLIERVWADASVAPAYREAMRCIYGLDGEEVKSVALLPQFFCEALGGDANQAVPIVATWNLLRYAGRLLDDIEDGERDMVSQQSRVDLNVSTGLIFTATLLLNKLETFRIDNETASAIREQLFRQLLVISGGQHLDITNTMLSLEECWEIAAAKTGVFSGLACWAGARVATVEESYLTACYELGYAMGLLSQIKDDAEDLWGSENTLSDMALGQGWSLPIAYAMSVLPERDREHLQACLEAAPTQVSAETTARDIIINSGAGVYLAVQAHIYDQQARTHLATLQLSSEHRDQMHHMLDMLRLTRTP